MTAPGFREAIGLTIDTPKHIACVYDPGGAIRQTDLNNGTTSIIRQQSAATGLCLIQQ